MINNNLSYINTLLITDNHKKETTPNIIDFFNSRPILAFKPTTNINNQEQKSKTSTLSSSKKNVEYLSDEINNIEASLQKLTKIKKEEYIKGENAYNQEVLELNNELALTKKYLKQAQDEYRQNISENLTDENFVNESIKKLKAAVNSFGKCEIKKLEKMNDAELVAATKNKMTTDELLDSFWIQDATMGYIASRLNNIQKNAGLEEDIKTSNNLNENITSIKDSIEKLEDSEENWSTEYPNHKSYGISNYVRSSKSSFETITDYGYQYIYYAIGNDKELAANKINQMALKIIK